MCPPLFVSYFPNFARDKCLMTYFSPPQDLQTIIGLNSVEKKKTRRSFPDFFAVCRSCNYHRLVRKLFQGLFFVCKRWFYDCSTHARSQTGANLHLLLLGAGILGGEAGKWVISWRLEQADWKVQRKFSLDGEIVMTNLSEPLNATHNTQLEERQPSLHCEVWNLRWPRSAFWVMLFLIISSSSHFLFDG